MKTALCYVFVVSSVSHKGRLVELGFILFTGFAAAECVPFRCLARTRCRGPGILLTEAQYKE